MDKNTPNHGFISCHQLRSACSPYWRLIRGDKPIGTLLLLWPTWSALWIAHRGVPSLHILFIFTFGIWLTRSAGCAINDYADQWLDVHVQRTQQRPLPSGQLTSKQALATFAIMMGVAFLLVLTLNLLTIKLSLIAALLAASYPFFKRYTYFPQVYLGAAFSWGIPMAFSAEQEAIPMYAWLLYVANVLWTIAYDTWYAMVDREDDIRVGAKSTAIFFGRYDLLAICIFYACAACLLLALGQLLRLGMAYKFGLIICSLLAVWIIMGGKSRERVACFRAFVRNQWIGCCFFITLVVIYMQ